MATVARTSSPDGDTKPSVMCQRFSKQRTCACIFSPRLIARVPSSNGCEESPGLAAGVILQWKTTYRGFPTGSQNHVAYCGPPGQSFFSRVSGMGAVMGVPGDLWLGIDLGIGSCGWALIRGDTGGIVCIGSRCFNVPETDKDRTPTNQIRRTNRSMRRVTRRRARRMKDVRALCRRFGLVDDASPEAFAAARLDPWALRAQGLERVLDGRELAALLLHVAKHRGFKSNSKRDRGANAPKDSSDMLKAIADTSARSASWRTVGEMFASDPAYAGRKRNREGRYDRSILRVDQEKEIALIFDRQCNFGNGHASSELEHAYSALAFFQRPVGDSEDKVGDCPFIAGEKRAARHAYSYERFRLLSRLAALRLRLGREEHALSPEQIAVVSADIGANRGLSFARLRRLLALDDRWRFDGVDPDDEKGRDVVARSGAAMPGCYALRQALGESPWRSLLATPDTLDRIAAVLAFRDDLDSIRAGLAELGLPALMLDVLMEAAGNGDFDEFTKAGHISAAACRAIIPYLEQGLVYSDACKAAGFDHSARPTTALEDIANPIARKALTEAVKQVRAIVAEFGLPDRIHIELARDVGKSQEERDEISHGIDRRNREKDRLRDELAEALGRPPLNGEELLRYELWKEQNGRCLYTDRAIPITAVAASDNLVQVDHILPWSRSGDDSFVNKTLCFAEANQKKKGRTPFEWFSADQDDKCWDAFSARVETLKGMKGRKKRNLLLKDAGVLEKKFRERNLNDTRYACRALVDILSNLYADDGRRHVFARPGPLTDRLRRAWGVNDLKKGPDGERLSDDRHHALDALVVASTSEGALNRLTHAFREAERMGAPRDFRAFDPPWPGFADQARGAVAAVFVSRPERHRARGEGHAATIRQIAERDGKAVVFERKGVEKLTAGDLNRIKDAERNHRLVESLRTWIEAGKPKDAPPLSPKGDPISKVRVATNKKVDVLVRDGAADRGEMVRVDVFRKQKPKGGFEFFLVPVYPHQVMDVADWPFPPNRAIKANEDETDWPVMGAEYEFLFSLRPFSYIQVIKSDGEVIDGYFRGVDRNTGALLISPHNDNTNIRKGIGSRTLNSIQKFHVDRLGRRFEIEQEPRTWHGVPCT